MSSYLIAVAIVFTLLAGWIAVDKLVHRYGPATPEDCKDPEGCHKCCLAGLCSLRDEARPDSNREH